MGDKSVLSLSQGVQLLLGFPQVGFYLFLLLLLFPPPSMAKKAL